jgi:hypothetical protein
MTQSLVCSSIFLGDGIGDGDFGGGGRRSHCKAKLQTSDARR